MSDVRKFVVSQTVFHYLKGVDSRVTLDPRLLPSIRVRGDRNRSQDPVGQSNRLSVLFPDRRKGVSCVVVHFLSTRTRTETHFDTRVLLYAHRIPVDVLVVPVRYLRKFDSWNEDKTESNFSFRSLLIVFRGPGRQIVSLKGFLDFLDLY